MAAIGILCERVRVEEKQILAALQRLGLPAVPVPPLDLPVAIGAGPHGEAVESSGGQYSLLIDRCPERSASGHLLTLLGESGVTVLGAGLASTGNRLDVARRLAGAGLARPRSMFVGSEKAGLAALKHIGYPSSLMPLALNKRPLPLFDADIAEAVLEHRNTLGSASARSMILQEGSPSITELVDVMVVDGAAVASSAAGKPALRHEHALKLAECAAEALHARIVSIRVAQIGSGVVVWDVDPAPEFRKFIQLGPLPVAEAIANLAGSYQPVPAVTAGGNRDASPLDHSAALQESAHGVVLSA